MAKKRNSKCRIIGNWTSDDGLMFFSQFQPFLEKYLKIQDTCGVHNLHALPGMLGGFIGAIVAAAADESVYSREGWVQKAWPRLSHRSLHLSTLISAPHPSKFQMTLWIKNFFSSLRLINTFDFEGEFANRSVGTQGGFQAAGTCVAIAFGLIGGAIVGGFEKYSSFNMKLMFLECF